LRVTLDRASASQETLAQLSALIEAAPGDLPVVLAFSPDGGATTSAFVRTATRVRADGALIERLRAVPAVLSVEPTMSEFS
jgi:hypothetical protein